MAESNLEYHCRKPQFARFHLLSFGPGETWREGCVDEAFHLTIGVHVKSCMGVNLIEKQMCTNRTGGGKRILPKVVRQTPAMKGVFEYVPESTVANFWLDSEVYCAVVEILYNAITVNVIGDSWELLVDCLGNIF